MSLVAVIGAGQIGSRHLQGLSRLATPCELFVVDPSPISLRRAQERYFELCTTQWISAVHFKDSIDCLPRTLDYAVVATAADVRLSVLKSLLGHSDVPYILLEKFLFQRVGDYADAEALLQVKKAQAWVNCPRRLFPLYNYVRDFFQGEPLRSFQVSGGNWGLGCNSVHFLDLLAFLTGTEPTWLSTDELDNELIPSKRKNFIEFTGALRGRFGAVRFELTSYAELGAHLFVQIRSEKKACVIDETSGQGFFFDGSVWSQKNCKLPLLSEITTLVAMRILDEGTCDLPSFAQSATYHLPLLRALGAHAAGAIGTPPNYCPIT